MVYPKALLAETGEARARRKLSQLKDDIAGTQVRLEQLLADAESARRELSSQLERQIS